MKRVIILLMALLFLLTGCGGVQGVDCMELAVAGDEWARFGYDVEGEEEFESDHIVTDDVFDREELIETVDAYAESESASDIFLSFYQQADRIEILPVFSMYLDYTDLAVITFYRDNEMFGVKIVDFKDDLKSLVEFDSDWTPDAFAHRPLSDEDCLSNFRSCFETNPNFEVVGIIFDYAPISNTHLLGRQPGSLKLQYANGSVIYDFGYVDSFGTVEAGRQAYHAFFEERQTMLEALLVFPWQVETLGYYTDWNYYSHTISFEEAGVTEAEMAALHQCEDLVCIPLLDTEGNEGVYQMYLLYRNNCLIAQMVFQNGDADASLVYHRINSSVTDGEQENAYMHSLRQAEAALRKNRNALRIVGVAFDGEAFVPMAKNDTQVYLFYEAKGKWVRADKG